MGLSCLCILFGEKDFAGCLINFRYKKALFGKESRQRRLTERLEKFCLYSMIGYKSALQTKRTARLSLVKRAVSVAD